MKPICQSVLGALTLMAAYHSASAATISETPFRLQNKVTTAQSKVKPNFMLLIDDSGSMNEPVNRRDSTTRLKATQDALYAVLDQYQDNFNWGLQTYHNNGRSDLNDYTSDWRDVKQRVGRIRPNDGTPTTRRYYEVTNIMRDKTKYRCEKNFIVVMTDGDANSSCTTGRWRNKTFNYSYKKNGQYVGSSWISWDKYFYDPYFGPGEPGRCENKDDGPVDSHWDVDNGLQFFSHTLATKDFKTEGIDRTGRSWNGDVRVDPTEEDRQTKQPKSKYEKQTINTFTIGLSGITRRGEDYLRNGASSYRGKKNFFIANDRQELLNAFKQAAESANESGGVVATATSGTVAPAIVANRSGAEGAISVLIDSGSWSSQIRFYEANKNDKKNLEFSEDYKEPSYTNRKTLINVGNGTHFVEKLNASPPGNEFFGITQTGQDANEWRDALLKWTARSADDNSIKNMAEQRKYSQPYRIREGKARNLGDIIDSPVTAIGSNETGRQEFLITSANDGMVHIFQKSEGDHPYDLKASYIPATMERSNENLASILKQVAHEEYGKTDANPHRYLINGGFTVLGTPKKENGDRHYFMFGAMGQGGRGAYALNVGGKHIHTGRPVGIHAEASSWESQVPLFETEKGEGNNLGFTIGTPRIGRVLVDASSRDIRYAGILASGYKNKPAKNGSSENVNETALYLYDMLGHDAVTAQPVSGSKPGQLLKKIVVADGVGGLSTPVLLDIESDGIYDLAYAGDYGGNLYRFDLRGGINEWKVTRIFTGNGNKPIVAAPTISYRPNGKYIVIVGTGSEVYDEDFNSTETQSVYGIFDDVNTTPSLPAQETDLLSQQFTQRRGFYYLSNNQIQPQHKGWKIDLSDLNGERVVTQGKMLLRTALIETRAYVKNTVSNKDEISGDICAVQKTEDTIEAKSRLLQINSTNGGALTKRDARVVYKDGGEDGNYFANGKLFNGLVSNGSVAAALKGDTLTVDGQNAGSGEEKPIKGPGESIKRQPNTCFKSKENQSIVLQSTEGELYSLQVDGPLCDQFVRRISWRELT